MKLIALLAAAALTACANVAPDTAAAPDSRLTKIRETQTTPVAYRSDAVPFAFEDQGKQGTGYSIEQCHRVISALEHHLGVSSVKINWVPVTLESRFDAVATGQADMECGSSTVTLGRMKT